MNAIKMPDKGINTGRILNVSLQRLKENIYYEIKKIYN